MALITCSSCDTKFRIGNLAVLDDGRIVRCSRCDYEWMVTSDSPEVSGDDSDLKSGEVEIGGKTQKVKKAKKSHRSSFSKMLAMFFVVLTAIFTVGIFALEDEALRFEDYYSDFLSTTRKNWAHLVEYIENSTGKKQQNTFLKLSEINIKPSIVENDIANNINLVIFNYSDKIYVINKIQILYYNGNGDIITEDTKDVHKILYQQETLKFSDQVEKNLAEISKIEILVNDMPLASKKFSDIKYGS